MVVAISGKLVVERLVIPYPSIETVLAFYLGGMVAGGLIAFCVFRRIDEELIFLDGIRAVVCAVLWPVSPYLFCEELVDYAAKEKSYKDQDVQDGDIS